MPAIAPSPQTPYHLRGFVYARRGADDDAWRATLMCNRRRVAKLTSEHRHGPIDVRFLSPNDHAVFLQHVASLSPTDSQDQDASTAFLLQLADRAYHARRLQVMALRHTLFRLVGDPRDTFRYLRNVPYSPASEGRLRLIFGQRVEEIVRASAAMAA
jgi:hypothetical protein